MISVFFDTSPLSSAHAGRGIGAYTKQLLAAMHLNPELLIFTPQDEPNRNSQDIIHYPSFDLFFPSLPLKHSKPFVVTVHDVIPLRFAEQYPRGVKGSLAWKRQEWALRQAAAVITDSYASQADILAFTKLPLEKVFVVPLASNPELQPPGPEVQQQIKRSLKLPKEYILYVGDINYNKNVPQLIKALKLLPKRLSLVCVGKNFYPQSIPEWQAIESQLTLSEVQDRVTFLTTIDSGDSETLATIYAQALATIQPSLWEGFGLPVIEALHCGSPVIVAHNSSLLEVGGPAATWVEPTAESIAAAVIQVDGWSESYRQKMIAVGKNWSSLFSWKTVAEQTQAVYETVLSITR